MKIRLHLLAVSTALALVPAAGSAEKKSFELDSAKLGAVKRVALVSVYGPTHYAEGMAQKIALQPFLDCTESVLTAALAQAGYKVVPVAETKAAMKSVFVPAFADAYLADYKRSHRRASETELQQRRAEIEAGGLQFAPRGLLAVSANTSFVFGTDFLIPPWNLHFTADGDPVTKNLRKPQHTAPAIAGLGAVAKALDADAVVIVRAHPGTAGVTAETKKPGMLGLVPAISNVTQQMKALRTGKYGAAILDVAMFGRAGERIFVDQVVGRSKEDEGNATVAFRLMQGVGESKAIALMKEALDTSIATTLRHLTGRELSPDTPGLGIDAIARTIGDGAARTLPYRRESAPPPAAK